MSLAAAMQMEQAHQARVRRWTTHAQIGLFGAEWVQRMVAVAAHFGGDAGSQLPTEDLAGPVRVSCEMQLLQAISINAFSNFAVLRPVRAALSAASVACSAVSFHNSLPTLHAVQYQAAR